MSCQLPLAALLCLTSIRAAYGDYHQSMILTTEWLVDRSSVICIAEFDDGESKKTDSIRRVVSTIKGDAKSLKWPLKRAEDLVPFYTCYSPSQRGKVRLLFIGESGELLQAVELGRQQVRYSPTLADVFYGTDQYGQLHLTESSLIRTIREHLNSRPGKRIAQRKTATFFKISGVTAPSDFPFETNHETFVLVVDFTEQRRDYYLKQLRTGDCAERVHAIHELSQLDDPVALAGIEAATRASGVERSHIFALKDHRVDAAPIAPDDMVRATARNVLMRLRRLP